MFQGGAQPLRPRPRRSACAAQHPRRHHGQQASTQPAPAGTSISAASALITAPAAKPGPLGPARARASRLQVYACAAAASHSGMHVPRGAGDQERPAPLPPFDPAGAGGHRGSAARTTTARRGPVFYKARQPPWRPRHLTGTSVLREALKYSHHRAAGIFPGFLATPQLSSANSA